MERALFIVAPQNLGKSTILRNMFYDFRLGRGGLLPTASRIAETYHLSNERRLYVRLTSPHEWGETLSQFLNKVAKKTPSGRWCFACPLQPDASSKMPDAIETVRAFVEKFQPERTRICFLLPDEQRRLAALTALNRLLPILHTIDTVECNFIVAETPFARANGLFLADFFDFT